MSEKPKPSVYLVDDDEAIRHSASFMLRAAGYRVQTFHDGVSFLDEIEALEEGCVLLDVQMPVLDGLAVLDRLNAQGVTMPVVVLTGHGDVAMAVRAMKSGAVDFVEKPYEKATLVDAIGQAFERIEALKPMEKLTADAHARLARLTSREREVLEGLAEGQTNKEIGATFDISPRTVEIHRANLMQKLEVDSLSAALRLAFAAGIGMEE